MSIETLTKAIGSVHIVVAYDGIFFAGGYYNGDRDIEIVENMLSEHGFERIIDDQQQKPEFIQYSEFRIWDSFFMRIKQK